MQNRIIDFITNHSNISDVSFRDMMNRTDVLVNDIGYILNGYEAVECGLIDQIGGISDAISYLRQERMDKYKNGKTIEKEEVIDG